MFKPIIFSLLSILIATKGFSNDKLNIALQYAPENLNPFSTNDTNGQFILNNIADGLIGWSIKEGIYPEIAESWEEKSNGHIIFTLRKNLKSFDGKYMGCGEVLKILKGNSAQPGPYELGYRNIKKMNCNEFGKLVINSVVSSKELINFLAGIPGKIIVLNNLKIVDGIGPFNLNVSNENIILLRNKHYYLSEKVYLNEINLLIKKDEDALKMFNEKKIDLIILSNLSNSKNLALLRKDDIVSVNLWATWGIAFNQKISPFNEQNLRRCLISNTSSEDWIKRFYPNDLAAYGPIPFGLNGYNSKKNSGTL